MISLPLLMLLAQADSPQSVWETPAMKAAQSLADSTRATQPSWLTLAESSNYAKTGRYAECVDFYKKLEKASGGLARLLPIGKTGEGRDLYVFVVSKDKAFTPEAAAKTNKPIILLQNGIHPGENGGKDASMMLLRDVLVTKRYAAWLDKVILLSIPVFNIDGHEHISPYNRVNENGPAEMGFRVTAQRYNLNRDYMKADSLEMKAWLRMYTSWLPDFLIDNHVTDGSDLQYDVTIALHTEVDLWESTANWVRASYLKQMWAAMEKDGHLIGWYVGGPPANVFTMAPPSPRFATGYAAAQNRASLLVETHSLKSFKTRTWAHFDIMRHTIDLIAANPGALKQAGRQADGAVASLKPGAQVVLDTKPGKQMEDYTMQLLETSRIPSTASGSTVLKYEAKPLNRAVKLNRSADPRTMASVPLGYIVPRPWTEIIELLRTHGVRMETIDKEITGEFETYRFTGVSFAPQPFEGRFSPSFTSRLMTEKRTIPAGSVYVPMEQRGGRAILHLLEPDGPDSAVRWGLLNAIFEQKEYFSDYIFAPIADKMLAADPKLKAEFDEKLKDAAFAANPRARLAWLFERSPYYEKDKDAYPIVRVLKKTW
jgi:hypothetical protein